MKRYFAAIASFLCLIHQASGALTTYQFLTDPSLINHWPGPDGLVGTGDDVIDGAATSIGGAGPNTLGAIAQGSFNFGNPNNDPKLFPGYHAITYVHLGSFVFDPDGGASGPLIVSFDIDEGSEPFIGHGPYNAVTTGTTVGTSTSSTFDLTAAPYMSMVNSTVDNATLFLSGNYSVIDPNGAATGDNYFDSVLTPIAQANNAESYVVITGEGGTGFDSIYGNIPVQFSLIGFEIVPEPSTLVLLLPALGLVCVRRRRSLRA